MIIYTIFDRPSDYPDHYVVREFCVTKEGAKPGRARIVKTLEHARLMVPQGLVRLNPSLDDDPCIVESWI